MDMINDPQFQKAQREINRELKKLHSGEINGNFMIEIMLEVLNRFPEKLRYLMPAQPTLAYALQHSDKNLLALVCDYIVGVHRSKNIFVPDEERAKREKDTNYRNELINDVYKMIELRPVIEPFLRTKQVIPGDRFLLFPIPYYSTVIAYSLGRHSRESKLFPDIYFSVAQKTLAVLSLLQDNLTACAYPTCRILIEEYFRVVVFLNCPEAYRDYLWFQRQELIKSVQGTWDDTEFKKRFQNRINQKNTSETNYLHYGWVDKIPQYNESIKRSPYSFGGIKRFVLEQVKDENDKIFFESLDRVHDMCHGYVHGSVGQSHFELLHYFDIAFIASRIATNLYGLLCDELGIDFTINGIDVLAELNKHFEFFEEAYSKRSDETFMEYYKKLMGVR